MIVMHKTYKEGGQWKIPMLKCVKLDKIRANGWIVTSNWRIAQYSKIKKKLEDFCLRNHITEALLE